MLTIEYHPNNYIIEKQSNSCSWEPCWQPIARNHPRKFVLGTRTCSWEPVLRTLAWEPVLAKLALGYVKSQLHQLDISHEIQELLDNSEDDEKLRGLDYAYGLSQSMRSKIAILDQAKILQDLTITRLREDADRMEAEQKELSALQAELKVNLQRTEAHLRKMLQKMSAR